MVDGEDYSLLGFNALQSGGNMSLLHKVSASINKAE
jgi:hypothetical protein